MKSHISLVFISLLCCGIAKKLPSTFKICSLDDPNLNDCVTKAIQQDIVYVKDGWPDLGIPSINPVKYASIASEGDPSNPVNVNQKLTNVEIHNLVNSKFTKTEVTFGTNDGTIVVHFTNELLKLVANYELNGKVLLFPITGSGKVTVNFIDVEVVVRLTGEKYQKKGKTHVKVNNVTMKVEPTKLTVHYENLFNGNEQLGNEMNKVLNENSKQIYEEVRPGYEEALAAFVKQVFSAVFDRVPFEDLFPIKVES